MPGVPAPRSSRAGAPIAELPVDLTANDSILPPSLVNWLEPEALEECLTFFTEKVDDECRAKRLVTLGENSNRIGSDNVDFVRYVDHVDLIIGRRSVRDVDDAGIGFAE